MGCTQSKIEQEETVLRCKDRKYHMKEAVSARNAFAAAHSLYTMALKNTGAALSDYANGEFQFLPNSSTSASVAGTAIPPVSQPSYDSLPPPPPPLPNFPPNPLQRAATMPEFSIPKPDPRPDPSSDPIIEEGDEEEEEEDLYEESGHDLKHRSTRSAGAGGGGGKSGVELPVNAPVVRNREPPPPPSPEMNGMSWDFLFAPMENVPNPSLADVDEGRIEREEMERKALEERARMAAAAEAERKAKEAAAAAEKAARERERERELELPPHPPPPEAVAKVVKKVRHVAAPVDGKRSGKGGGGVNLLQAFSDIDDCFLKAFESAHEVSKMLEANRLHYHSNFADNRGHLSLFIIGSICGGLLSF